MCGIFGANKGTDFTDLYTLNVDRGAFSFGLYNPFDGVVKSKEPVSLTQYIAGEAGPFGFHTRAPTSLTAGFNPTDSHPFEFGEYVVGHNGIINNHAALRIKYNLNGISSVDSAVIPALISHFAYNGKTCVEAISLALPELKGTFGVWIVNRRTQKMYLARSSSTIYVQTYLIHNLLTFSSTPLNPLDFLLREGIVYELGSDLKEIGTFKTKTPFFVL